MKKIQTTKLQLETMIKTAERLDSKVEDLMLSYLKVKNEMKEAREEWLKCLIIREG